MKSILCVILGFLIGTALSVPATRRGPIPAFFQVGGPCSQLPGHTGGCCTEGEVECFRQSEQCSCQELCYIDNSCCSDIRSVGCFPTTCTTSGVPAGCCQWASNNCYVSARQCYCDSICSYFNDCCSDVTSTSCSIKDLQLSHIQGLAHRRSGRKLSRYDRRQKQRQSDTVYAERKMSKLLSSNE